MKEHNRLFIGIKLSTEDAYRISMTMLEIDNLQTICFGFLHPVVTQMFSEE